MKWNEPKVLATLDKQFQNNFFKNQNNPVEADNNNVILPSVHTRIPII